MQIKLFSQNFNYIKPTFKGISGVSHSGIAPLKTDVVSFGQKENISQTAETGKSKKEIQNINKEIAKAKRNLNKAIKKNDAEKIFEYFGVKVEKDSNGNLIIEKFSQPSAFYTFSDIGIDEDSLFRKVKAITSDADFSTSSISEMQNLEFIGGNANFKNSKICPN